MLLDKLSGLTESYHCVLFKACSVKIGHLQSLKVTDI